MAVDDFGVDLPKGPPSYTNPLALSHLDLVPVSNPGRLANDVSNGEQVLSLQRVYGIPLPLHAVGPNRLLRTQSSQGGGWVPFSGHTICEYGCKFHQVLSPCL
jgi:hypothetical protein